MWCVCLDSHLQRYYIEEDYWGRPWFSLNAQKIFNIRLLSESSKSWQFKGTRLAGWNQYSLTQRICGTDGTYKPFRELLFTNLPSVPGFNGHMINSPFPFYRGIRTIIPIKGCGNYSLAIYTFISLRKGPCDIVPEHPPTFFFALDQSMSFNSTTWFTKIPGKL